MSAPSHVLQHSKSATEASAKGPQKPRALVADVLLTPTEAGQILKVSLSWLAKARMRGDGPPFIKIGPWILEPSATALYENRICTSLPSSLRIA
jgi:hypothetical protein